MTRPRFALLTFAGLGEIAARELGLSPGYRIERLKNQDLVVCTPDVEQTGRMARLRSVEDVFLLLGGPVDVESGRDLGRLGRLLSHDAIMQGVQLRNRLFASSKPKRVTFNCFVKQDRDYPVQRREIEAAVTAALGSAFPRWKLADPAALEIWAFYVDRRVRLGLRLTTRSMRYHGRAPATRKGALRPSIAGALVSLAAPGPDDVVLDPMCGTGSILREAGAAGVAALGGDIDHEALAHAREAGLAVARWDATTLPLGNAAIDCVICNLPFGRQYTGEDGLRALYTACIGEWRRVLRPSGRLVLLTSQSRLLSGVLAGASLRLAATHKVKVLGIWATIHLAVTAE